MSYAEDADHLQGNAAKLYYFAEKDRLGWFMCFVVLWVVVGEVSAIISE